MAEIPDWLTKLAGTAKYLPLKTRQKMLPNVVYSLHKTGLLSELTGDALSQAAVYTAHFLGGSGEPLELEIGDDEWKSLVKEADKETRVFGGVGQRKRSEKNPWTPSTNPEYHADQGWEWKQIDPRWGSDYEKNPLYNIIGSTTTVRRRKIDKDKYEYQIAEDFDFTEGKTSGFFGKKATTFDMAMRRLPHSKVAKFIEAFFPEYTESRGGIIRLIGNELKGAPVPIKSSYIHNTNRNVEDDLVDFFKKTGKGIF